MTEAPTIEELDAGLKTNAARRRRGWAFVAALTLVVGIVLWGTWLAIVAADRQMGKTALRRLRDAGDPTTPEEMQAFYPTSPEMERAADHWLRAIAAHDATRPYPGWEAPTPDERGLYDQETLALIEPFLATREATLREVHRAREAGGVARLPFSFENVNTARLPTYLASLRELGNLMILQAHARAARGDLSGATDSLLGMVAVSESLSEQPMAVSLLIRVGILTLAVYHTTTLIQTADFSEEDLLRLQAAFARQDLHSHFLRAMRGEQFAAMEIFEIEHGMPLRGADQAMAVDIWQEFLAEARKGFPEADAAAERRDARIADLDESRWDQWRYRFTILSVGGGPTLHATVTCQADACNAVAAIACVRYRQDRGEWPPTLEALVPDYLAAVPLDPVDDSPLRYERQTERVVIYSRVHDRPVNQSKLSPRNAFGSRVLGKPFPATP